MAFIRTRTIKGKTYRFLEWRWREGKKVHSRSRSLGVRAAALSQDWMFDARGRHIGDDKHDPIALQKEHTERKGREAKAREAQQRAVQDELQSAARPVADKPSSASPSASPASPSGTETPSAPGASAPEVEGF